jgi:hypothetical protein
MSGKNGGTLPKNSPLRRMDDDFHLIETAFRSMARNLRAPCEGTHGSGGASRTHEDIEMRDAAPATKPSMVMRHEDVAPGTPSIFEISNLSLYDLTVPIRLRQAS